MDLFEVLLGLTQKYGLAALALLVNVVTLYFVYKLHLAGTKQTSNIEKVQQQLDAHERHCEERKRDSVKARDTLKTQIDSHEKKTDEALVRIHSRLDENDKRTQKSFSNVHKKIEDYTRNVQDEIKSINSALSDVKVGIGRLEDGPTSRR